MFFSLQATGRGGRGGWKHWNVVHGFVSTRASPFVTAVHHPRSVSILKSCFPSQYSFSFLRYLRGVLLMSVHECVYYHRLMICVCMRSECSSMLVQLVFVGDIRLLNFSGCGARCICDIDARVYVAFFVVPCVYVPKIIYCA